MKIAFILSSPLKSGSMDLLKEYKGFDFDYDILYLSDEEVEKILKKNLTLDMGKLKEYDLLCPVGADSLKHACGLSGITKYAGTFVEPNYVPFIDPNMVFVKPQYASTIEKSIEELKNRISGVKVIPNKKDYHYFTSVEKAKPYIDKLLSPEVNTIVCDIETTSLSPRTGNILGFALSTREHEGVYIDADIVEYFYDEFAHIFATKKIIFHNAKFDMSFIKHEFGFEFNDFEDTLLLHYVLDESVGSHGLKTLAMKFTDLGDYDKELEDYKKQWARQNKVLLKDFNYGMLPAEILAPYAQRDADSTFQIFNKFYPKVRSNKDFQRLYETILKPSTLAIMFLEHTGGPIDVDTLDHLIEDYQIDIEETLNEINMHPAVQQFENQQDKPFNPNSVYHLRELFFNILKLKPIKKTATGALSTDAEVLGLLDHPLAEAVLDLRKKVKLSKTYLVNIKNGLDKDNRLRSNFNITGTTSGRLSSSGVLNYQNLPRDKNSGIKKIFKANPGYSIVQVDLSTAEVLIAAALSNDKFLQQAFIDGLDFHSYVAKNMFDLPCSIDEVKHLYPNERQNAKAITFGILYGASATKISEQAGVSFEEAKKFIALYFRQAHILKSWIDESLDFIKTHAFIYSAFGRKRRLPESRASNKGVASHATRSGLNFLIQSVASDVNLMGMIDLVNWIKENEYEDLMRVFATVHDSIVAEVKDEYVDEYCANIGKFLQTDRGVSIPDCPIGFDIEVGPSWGELDAYKAPYIKEAI